MKWNYYSFSDLAKRFISGGTPNTKVSDYWEGNIPWITGADINERIVYEGRKFITDSGLKNSATNIVPRNSILFVTRTGVGKVAKAGRDIAISQDITGISFKRAVDPDFVIYAAAYLMKPLIAVQQGSTIKGIIRSDLERFKIPLPPLSEQRRIVEILDQADAIRKLRKQADEKSERIILALFYEMFGDPILNPQNWPKNRFIIEAQINPKRDKKYSEDLQVAFVPMSDVDEIWGRIIGNQIKSFIGVKKGFTYFEENDVLFAKITPCMENGKAAIARKLKNGIGFGSTEFHVLRCKENILPEYVFSLVRLPVFRSFAKANFTGTAGQQRVPSNFIENFNIPIPEKSLQIKFASMFNNIYQTIPTIERSEEKLRVLFETLLSKAFDGNLTATWRAAHMKELLQEMEEQKKYLEKVN